MPVIYVMPQINQIALSFMFISVDYLGITERKKAKIHFFGFWLLL